jgi:hypothetical protein
LAVSNVIRHIAVAPVFWTVHPTTGAAFAGFTTWGGALRHVWPGTAAILVTEAIWGGSVAIAAEAWCRRHDQPARLRDELTRARIRIPLGQPKEVAA